jgi:hypothetical protein
MLCIKSLISHDIAAGNLTVPIPLHISLVINDRLVNLVRGWPALTEKTIAGVHFVQEDSPHEIGKAIVDWMGEMR